MANSGTRFARRHTLGLALSVFVGLSLIGCGTQTGAGSGANGQGIQTAPFFAAPIEGSPEDAVLKMDPRSSYSAPIEGTPEQTAAEMGR